MRRGAVIGATLLTATLAHADDVPFCPDLSLRPAVPVTAAQESWPLVARNAFAADGTGEQYLHITLLLPVVRGDSPPCLAAYIVEDLRKSETGEITGVIIPTSMDNPVFFNESVAIDPARIVDWRYTPDVEGLRFGNYLLRQRFGDSEAALLQSGLSPTPVPATWQ